MCEFAGWCALGTSDWVGAIGSVLGGIGAAAAAWVSLAIAKSIRAEEVKRRRADATALLRLTTPELTILPAKLHRWVVDIEECRAWWGSPVAMAMNPAPRKLRTALEQLSEDPIPHTAAAIDRVAVLDDLGYGSIANDLSTTVAHVRGLRDAAKNTLGFLDEEQHELGERVPKVIRMAAFLRDLAVQLANEMQPTIGMEKTDYGKLFARE